MGTSLRRGSAAAAIALCFFLTVITAAQTSAPPTAGAVALLGNKLDRTAVEAVMRAMTADDAVARSVAARIAAVTAHAPFGPVVQAAWERETNSTAAAEQVRALLYIRGALAIDAIDAKLDAAPESVALIYSEWLASTRPERFVELLPRLVARASGDRRALGALVNRVIETRPPLTERVLRVWLAASTQQSWRNVIEVLSLEEAPPGLVAVMTDALNGGDSGVREATVWTLVGRLGAGLVVPATLLEAAAVRRADSTAADPPLTWEQFGREIVTRQIQRKAQTDRSAFLIDEARKRWSDARAIAGTDYLPGTERKALERALGDQFPHLTKGRVPRTITARGMAAQPSTAMRMMPTLWPGFLKSLIEASQCLPPRGDRPPLGVVSAFYRPDHAIAKLTITPTMLSPECEGALTALARLTLAEPTDLPPAGGPEFLVLPLDAEFIECVSQSTVDRTPAARAGGAIVPPRKTRDVRPVYPEPLRQRRVQGEVLLEAVISPSGCVTGIKVVRGVEPGLDIAALHAVTGWRFTPTLLDGVPVPVIMTVTVTFRLS
jgi:TonB family protein